MKKFVVNVNLNRRANAQDTFVIEAESIHDQSFKDKLYKEICCMCYGEAEEMLANAVSDADEDETSPFDSFSIYEVVDEADDETISDLTKWFVKKFIKQQEEDLERREQQLQEQRRQDYLLLKKEFEKS